MKYGIMYAYFNNEWEGEYPATIERVARLGFDIMEIHTPLLLGMTDAALGELKRCADYNGVELSYDICLSGETDISSGDVAVQKNGIDYVLKTLRQINKLGGKNVGGINFVAWNEFDAVIDKERRTGNSVKCMKKIAKCAEDFGIMYGVEVTNRFEQFMLNTAEEAVDYCERVGSPNIGIHMDINHMLIEERDIYKALITAGSRLSHFHVAESDRSVPKGGGFIPWQDVARGLKDIGYDRAITLEPFLLIGGGVARDAKIWRPLAADAGMETLEDEISIALSFIKGLLKAG